MRKWIILIFLGFTILLIVLVIGIFQTFGQKLQCDSEFFFNGWEIIAIIEGQYPYAALVVTNPEKTRNVKVFVDRAQKTIDGYAYWENNEIKIFFGNNKGEYPRGETPKGCYRCHPKSTPL